MKKGFLILALAVSLFIHWYVVQNFSVLKEQRGKYWHMVAVFYGIMLLGCLGKEAYNMLVNKKPFNWVSMGIAAIVSPMIFGAIFSQIGNLELAVPNIVLTFQNGFFWNSIFDGLGASNQ